MVFDTYIGADAEGLLQPRHPRREALALARPVPLTALGAAAAVLAAAAAVAVLGPQGHQLSLWALALTGVAYLAACRVRFPVGSAWTCPTQVVFVPMLFLLPLRLVPLIVIAFGLTDAWSCALRHELTLARVLARIADSAHALGPAVVLILAGEQRFGWQHLPILIFAFAAQVGLDAGCGLARTWISGRPTASSHQSQMAWLYLTDLCLSCVGLLVAGSAVRKPVVVLLAVPLMVLFGLFARERQERVDNTLELRAAYHGTALLLGEVVEADDGYTGAHSREVVELSLAVADGLDVPLATRRAVELGALLHDVGKIRVPKEIINKPGKLDSHEWDVMRRHTILGEAMLATVGGALSDVGRIVRSSHERFDGGGYPDGLAGEAIPIESRIVSACDAYNAMTTDRPYRAALSQEQAIAELRRCSGTQFDPRIVSVLVAAVTGTPALPGGEAGISSKRPWQRMPVSGRVLVRRRGSVGHRDPAIRA